MTNTYMVKGYIDTWDRVKPCVGDTRRQCVVEANNPRDAALIYAKHHSLTQELYGEENDKNFACMGSDDDYITVWKINVLR